LARRFQVVPAALVVETRARRPLLGATAFGYAQHEQHRENQGKPEKQAEHERQKGKQQQQDQNKQQQDQNKQAQHARQQQPEHTQRASLSEHRKVWQQHRAQNWESEHRTWQQRGSYNGYRIPEDRFRRYYGRDHWFRVCRLPFMVEGGYPRFRYGGYWVSFVDQHPEYWGDNWYETDESRIPCRDESQRTGNC